MSVNLASLAWKVIPKLNIIDSKNGILLPKLFWPNVRKNVVYAFEKVDRQWFGSFFFENETNSEI